MAPDGTNTLFAQIDATKLPGPCPGGIGLTTALVVLRSGWVIVGSLPTTDGTSATAQAGCFLVLDNHGQRLGNLLWIAHQRPLGHDGAGFGQQRNLFVTNVLNGTLAGGGKVVHGGTVVRLTLTISPKSAPVAAIDHGNWIGLR